MRWARVNLLAVAIAYSLKGYSLARRTPPRWHRGYSPLWGHYPHALACILGPKPAFRGNHPDPRINGIYIIYLYFGRLLWSDVGVEVLPWHDTCLHGSRVVGIQQRVLGTARWGNQFRAACGHDVGEMTLSRDGELQGLCWKCANAADCALPLASNFPVVECSTYQASVTTRVVSANPSARLQTQGEVKEHRGLCSDCELRSGCTISRPESGVWHCKNYR